MKLYLLIQHVLVLEAETDNFCSVFLHIIIEFLCFEKDLKIVTNISLSISITLFFLFFFFLGSRPSWSYQLLQTPHFYTGLYITFKTL